MRQRVELMDGDQVHHLDVMDLEAELQRGLHGPATRVRFPAWTGQDFKPVSEIPALAPALATPPARAHAFLTRTRPAWAWALLMGAILLASMALVSPWVDLDHVDMGREGVLFDNNPLRTWTFWLAHAGPLHLIGNLPPLAYSAWRVERALGARAVLAVLAASLIGAALAIPISETHPVVGASGVFYAFWGAQVATGLRYGEALPPGQRGAYGFGTLPLLIPVLGSSFFNVGVSHAAHLSGLVAGGIVGFAWRPPEHWPERKSPLTNALLALLVAAPPLLALLLRAFPAVALGGITRVELEPGLSMELPQAWIPEPVPGEEPAPASMTWRGRWAWRSGTDPESPWLAVGRVRISDDRIADPEVEALVSQGWEEAPELALGEGWRAFAEAGGQVHTYRQGSWLVVADWNQDMGRRAALYRRLAESVEVGETAELIEARAALEAAPNSPKAKLGLARAMVNAGLYAEADALYASLLDGASGGTAGWERLWLWSRLPALFPPPEGPPWFSALLEEYPQDRDIHEAAVRWLSHHGRCPELVQVVTAFAQARPDAPELPAFQRAADECGA